MVCMQMFGDIRTLMALSDDFCDASGANCSSTATGFGTVTVQDSYGSGSDMSYTWTTCIDEYHVATGDVDPCATA
ncbi:hypothetical protein GUITHDRAFT_150076 [Guillardia theta CCMP2712]|uniref:Uncharacterized protein n=1 Tax=Guillardia theta (strain CCMP2712) TaxID=905079 RepID=L1K2Q5_GUITC|nr:hypothetical protein GUITHDRAFT_150076 [Guillardia theta CCMP2712]EKX54653.1 hypothetical protein GUITHDRAFT_150076 [Guillardia theta CCMP2712]|eukprot:XP_005841633.1 hypothetical protein GUITHDRAFT_150076 [Guillardia theta CCMP2712]